MPQIVKDDSLPEISRATIVPVYFPGDSFQSGIDEDFAAWPSTPAFQTLGEYGIKSVSAGTSIVLSETPAATLTQKDVEAWVTSKLDGTHAEFGTVDAATLASKVFVIFFPPTTTVTWYTVSLCQGSYNAGVVLASGAVANYAVVAECGNDEGTHEVDQLAGAGLSGAAYQLASPDPKLQVYPSNWGSFDTAHAAYSRVALGFSMISGCNLARFTPTGWGLGAPLPIPLDVDVQDAWQGTVWSNKAAAAYHDPCIPDPTGPYFVSVPILHDEVQVTLQPYLGEKLVTSTGVLVPVGSTKTIDVELLSDAPTNGPWTVSTQLLEDNGFTFTFDRATGQNGDVLHLSITAPTTPQQGTVAVYSKLEGRRTFYLLPVQSM